MKIMTLGKGFIANHLPYEQITEKLIPWQSHVRKTLEHFKPDVLVNCVGITGRPNIDWCESNKSETYIGNVVLPALVGAECEKLEIHHIMIGSGCIFFGKSPNFHCVQNDGSPLPPQPPSQFHGTWMGTFLHPGIEIDDGWKETDFANPQSYYSKTKYSCDLLLGDLKYNTTLRIRMPISPKNEPRNFISKIKGYSKVIDIPNSITMVDDLVRCIDWFANESKFGIYHVANPLPLSAARVMREYQKYNPDHIFEVINESQLDELTLAKRSNCILNTDNLTNAGFIMTPSEEALIDCMKKYVSC